MIENVNLNGINSANGETCALSIFEHVRWAPEGLHVCMDATKDLYCI
jgi:hypothetical protein